MSDDGAATGRVFLSENASSAAVIGTGPGPVITIQLGGKRQVFYRSYVRVQAGPHGDPPTVTMTFELPDDGHWYRVEAGVTRPRETDPPQWWELRRRWYKWRERDTVVTGRHQ